MKSIFKTVLISLLFLLCLSGISLKAQDNDALNKIESARIALITERLGLTPEQAERFWPVYNEFIQKRKELQQGLKQEREGVDMNNLTEEEGQRLMDMAMDIKQRQLDLEKAYSQRLQHIISAQQVMALRKAEEDFRRMIIERLQERRMQQMRREEMMQRRGN
ncbi:MAG TPA: hypothetical protein VI583_07485 [Cyclobacteriaceae bacterium]|nr:hypothetical protein [Cyclobacteriaceae bacterium]